MWLILGYLTLTVVAFQLHGKFKRVSRSKGKNILKWTSAKQLLLGRDEEVIDFERKAKGFVEVDKKLKRSLLYLDSNRNGLLDSSDELLFTDNLGYSKKLYKARKGKIKGTNVVEDLNELMGEHLDLREELAEGYHSTGLALFNMTSKKGKQLGYVYMGSIDRGYASIMCSGEPNDDWFSEQCASL